MTYLGYPIPGTPVTWPPTHLAPIDPAPLPGQARVGVCSLCGGSVIGHRGAWWGVIPPPADQCSLCGALRADADDIIQMRRR
jgi:hypothetical protein